MFRAGAGGLKRLHVVDREIDLTVGDMRSQDGFQKRRRSFRPRGSHERIEQVERLFVLVPR